MNRSAGIAAGAATLLVLLGAMLGPRPALVWNLTPSVPVGLYRIADARRLHVGDRVAIEPPAPVRQLLSDRGYLAGSAPLLKRVAALPGQRVCRTGALVTIDGRFAARALARDRKGRSLPVWAGCRVISSHEVFVLSPMQGASFDGRYFGPIMRRHVIGRAAPVWTDEAGSGAHEWFATPLRMGSPH